MPNRKFHNKQKFVGVYELKKADVKSQTQLFIDNYKQFQSQGALDEQKLYETAYDKTLEEVKARKDMKIMSAPRPANRFTKKKAAPKLTKKELGQEEKDFEFDVSDSWNEEDQTQTPEKKSAADKKPDINVDDLFGDKTSSKK